MASDFERFLGEITAQMGLPSAPSPVVRTPRPTPAPSPFANATPQQQQQIQRASAGLPPDLVAQLAQLAVSPVAQQMPPAPQQPRIDPNMTASTGVVGTSVQRQEQPKPKESPYAAKEGEGYVLIEYDTQTEDGMVIVAVPERYRDTLPPTARVYGDGQVIPAQAKDSIAANNQLLEQQPSEIQNGIVAPSQVREEMYPSADKPTAPVSTQPPLMRVQDAEGKVHLVPDADEVPEGMTLISRAGEKPKDTTLQAIQEPTVVGEKTQQQQADMREQNVIEIDAEGNPVEPEEELVVITLDEFRATGDPDNITFADQLEASGLTEYRSDMYYTQDPETGRISAMTKEEYEKKYPDEQPLKPMTTNIMREEHGMVTEANELESQGIYAIPDGKMAVKRNGRWTIVTASENPQNVENVVYGGKSRELEDKSILGDMDDLRGVPGSLMSGGLDLLGKLDKPRRWTNEQMGNVLYERASGNDVDLPGWDPLTAFLLGAPETDLKPGKTKLTSEEGSIGEWAKANPDKVIDLYENGYDSDGDGVVDFTGGEAVFEYWIGTQNKFTRIVGELAGDPLNVATGGGGLLRRGAAKVAGPTLARSATSRGLETTGRLLQLPDTVMDTILSRGARGVVNTVTSEPMRATIRKNLADDIAGLTGSAPVRAIARAFELAPDAQVAINTGDVNRGLSTMVDQQAVTRPLDPPTTGLAGDVPPDASAGPVTRTPRDPEPTPGQPEPRATVASSVDTPPIPYEVIDNLPPAQKALYQNWDQQPLDIADESPFAYREDGSVTTDWDFANPRTDEEGKRIAALLDEDDYARRIIDETFVSLRESMPDRWKFFVDAHDPKVRRFIQRERYIQGRSVDSKNLRKDFDYAQKQLSQINEARYVVDDLIPDFKRAFPDQAIPEYRFKNKLKGDMPTTGDRDDALIEAAIFGNADQATEARRIIGNRAFNTNDVHLAAIAQSIDSTRARYLSILDGNIPEPRVATPRGNISTDVAPTTPQEPVGLLDAPLDVPEAPQRMGLGLPSEEATKAQRQVWNKTNGIFRATARNNGISSEGISAYARRKGYGSASDIPEPELRMLRREIERNPAVMRDMFESMADASAPRGVAGIEQMPPSNIKTTWGMKKRQLQKNLGVDRSLQPRSKPFDEEHVRGIVDNYIGERMDPIIVKRGADGETYVVAGHNRLEAAKRLNVDVPIRYTDASGDELLRLSRDTNMQNLGMSNATIAASVREMVDAGKSFEEIGRALKLSPDGIAKTPATMAERYYNFSFLREGSNLHRLADQGIIPMEVAANAGRGIRNGNLTQAEVESLAMRVTDNRLNPKYFDGIIKRAIKRAEEGKSSQMGGLLEGMNVSDNLKAAEDEFLGQWDEWRKVHDEWKLLNDKKTTGMLDPKEKVRLSQMEADKVRLADELDIPDNKLYMREPTADGYLSRDYQVDGTTAPVARVADDVVDNAGEPVVDAAQQMRDNGASPLFSTRQTADPRWSPRPINQHVSQPTAAVAVYGHPLGQWEFPNLNLRKLSDGVKKAWGDPYGDRAVTSEFLSDAGTPQRPGRQSAGNEYWGDPSRMPEPELKYVRGRVIDEGSWDHQLLTQQFDDGEEIIQRWERLANEYESKGLTSDQADVRAADQVMADWGEQAIKNYDAKNGTEFHAKYKKELDRLTNKGKKEDRLSGTHAQMVAANRAMGDTNKVVSFYDEYLGVMREMTLYNALSGPRYIMTQLIGNTITAMITGNFSVVGRAIGDYKSSYQQMSGRSDDWVVRMLGGIDDGELSEVTMRQGIRELEGKPGMILHDTTDRHMMEWNIAGMRDDIANVVRDEVTDVGKPTRFSRLRLGSMNIGKRVDGVFANRAVRDMANAWDLSYRKAMYGEMLRQNNAGARIAMRNRMMDTMPSTMPTSEFDRLWNELPEVFGSDRIRDVFGAVDAKWADRMARDWQSAIRKMDLDARDKTYKLFFSGYERNADKALRRVVFFHYWMSRATPLYTEALMRNPGVLNAYVKMLAEIKEQEESGKFGSAVNGFLKWMSTPFGFTIFIRPDAFLQTVFALDDGSDFTPEGETWLGSLMRHTPLMINPLIDSAANLLGFQGDTFAPDPLMIGQWSNLTTNGINLFNSLTGREVGPARNVPTEFWGWVRSHTSGIVPGTQEIGMTDSTQYARRDINYFIMEEAERQGLDPLGVEAMAAMDDPSSPLYKSGFSQYSQMKMLEHGLRFFPLTAPLYPKVRANAGDETRYIVNTAEPGSTEREQAINERAIAQTSNPEARKLAIQQKEYTQLGTPDEREAYTTYNGILYGGLEEPVVIDGVAVNDWALMKMSADERQIAADAWAEQSGNAEKVETVRTLRKEYREAHPEYNDYIQWRFSVSDYEGGAIEYWGDLAEGNPNAERFLSSVEDDTPDAIEMELTSVTAYMQYMGIRPTIYDPNPLSTNNGQGQPYNPAGSGSGTGSGNGYNSGTTTTIEEDIAAYEEEMAAFTEKYGNLQNMTPPMREATLQLARDNGDSIPYLSGQASDYLEWMAAQPPGTDTSTAAYKRWKGEDEEESGDQEQPAPAKRKEGLVAPAQPQYSSGINELLSMLQF